MRGRKLIQWTVIVSGIGLAAGWLHPFAGAAWAAEPAVSAPATAPAMAPAGGAAAGPVATPVAAPAAGSPEATVAAYMQAIQKGDYAAAYPLLSKDMVVGKSKDEWVKEAKVVMGLSEASISSYRVYPARMQGEGKAIVPNLLRSPDKILNPLGLPEHELYTLTKDPAGAWIIDRQELVEPENISKWFPADAR